MNNRDVIQILERIDGQDDEEVISLLEWKTMIDYMRLLGLTEVDADSLRGEAEQHMVNALSYLALAKGSANLALMKSPIARS